MRLLWLGIAVMALVVLDRALLAAEAKGWIYWRRRAPSQSSVGDALQQVQALVEPGAHHVVEERDRQQDAADEDPGPDPLPPHRR